MTAPPLVVRDAVEADFAAIQSIYAHHVATGMGSFEEEPPELDEMRRRHAEISAGDLPFLVADIDGRITGFAYAAPYRPRPAYRHTIEDSVYVSPAAQGGGHGRALLAELVNRCEALGYYQMIAVIGGSENHASIGLHGSMGFVEAGTLRSVGRKFGRWVDVVLMQRALAENHSGPE